jgi:hypothetical protein
MSDRIKKNVEFLALLVAIAGAVVGLFGAFVVLPTRVQALESQVEKLTARDQTRNDLLIRLEENGKRIEQKIDYMAAEVAAQRKGKQ